MCEISMHSHAERGNEGKAGGIAMKKIVLGLVFFSFLRSALERIGAYNG